MRSTGSVSSTVSAVRSCCAGLSERGLPPAVDSLDLARSAGMSLRTGRPIRTLQTTRYGPRTLQPITAVFGAESPGQRLNRRSLTLSGTGGVLMFWSCAGLGAGPAPAGPGPATGRPAVRPAARRWRLYSGSLVHVQSTIPIGSRTDTLSSCDWRRPSSTSSIRLCLEHGVSRALLLRRAMQPGLRPAVDSLDLARLAGMALRLGRRIRTLLTTGYGPRTFQPITAVFGAESPGQRLNRRSLRYPVPEES